MGKKFSFNLRVCCLNSRFRVVHIVKKWFFNLRTSLKRKKRKNIDAKSVSMHWKLEMETSMGNFTGSSWVLQKVVFSPRHKLSSIRC